MTGLPTSFLNLRHQHKKADPERISHPEPKEQTLGDKLLLFIRSETRFLSDTMNIDACLSPEIQLPSHKIDPAIYKRLQTEPDIYQQFVILLRLPKFAVHPDVLFECYLLLPALEESERQLLLKKLIFHCQWNKFLRIAITDTTSLSDVEDIVDLLHHELDANNNYTFGVWELIRACLYEIPIASLLSSLLESIGYKFGISATQIALFSEYIRELDNIDTKEELEQFRENKADIISTNFICQAFLVKAQVRLGDTRTYLEGIKVMSSTLRTPGWYSFLTSTYPKRLCYLSTEATELAASGITEKPALMKFFLHHRLIGLNEMDLFCLLQSATAREARSMYLMVHRNYQRGYLTSLRLVNQVVMLCTLSHDENLMMEIARKYAKIISPTLWRGLIPVILKHDTKVLRAAERALGSKLCTICYDAFKDSLTSDIISSIVSNCNNNRLVIRLVLKITSISDSDARAILDGISQMKFTTYNLMELFRFALRHRIVDKQAFFLFDKILSTSCKRVELKSYSTKVCSSSDVLSGFYALASEVERFKFNQTLQTLSQAVSVLDKNVLIEFLDNLHIHLFLSKASYVTSHAGQCLIFNNILRKVFHFVEKAHLKVGSTDSGTMIKSVLQGISFKTSIGQAIIFELMVRDDPLMAFNILRRHKTKKAKLVKPFIEAIARGLLKSEKLAIDQKILALENFIQIARKMGYRHVLSARVAVQYGTLMIKKEPSSARVVTEALKKFSSRGFAREIPRSVIRKWSQVKN